MFCGACGQENLSEHQFCSACGKSLGISDYQRMPEKVAKVGIRKQLGYSYVVDDRGDISRSGEPLNGVIGECPETVAKVGIRKQAGYHYFVDDQGDVSRVGRKEESDGHSALKEEYEVDNSHKTLRSPVFWLVVIIGVAWVIGLCQQDWGVPSKPKVKPLTAVEKVAFEEMERDMRAGRFYDDEHYFRKYPSLCEGENAKYCK